MADLATDVRYIKGIGEQRAKALAKLDIRTLRDLISWFPRRYEDRTVLRSIAELPEDNDMRMEDGETHKCIYRFYLQKGEIK